MTGITLVHKDKNKVKLRNYQERGKAEELGILNLEKQQGFNEKPQALGINPTLIDILHRLLWLAENSPLEMNNFLIQAQPDAAKLRLVAQSLAGRALTANSLPLETDGENLQPATPRSAEQQAIDTLLASWKRTIEDNLFTRGG